MLKVVRKTCIYFIVLMAGIFSCVVAICQTTTIKGFADVTTTYDGKKTSIGFDEQDLFITSELSDRLSFLGESVFKYTPSSPTQFSVSIERLIINYNIYGNNNLIMGKVHTPINYWNDTYHHGRLFFPTIERPLLFAAEIIPLHTIGLDLQGHDFGNIKFGYDLVVGNGLGTEGVNDNDKYKSITAAVHIKPLDKMRIGLSYYNDVISKGALNNDGKIINWQVNQQLISPSFAYFGKKFEVLTEGTLGFNHTDTTGSKRTTAGYFYGGYRINDKLTPYVRVDNLNYQTGEIYFTKNNTTSFVAGMRYQINFLAVIKLEYQHQHDEMLGNTDKATFQFAIGF